MRRKAVVYLLVVGGAWAVMGVALFVMDAALEGSEPDGAPQSVTGERNGGGGRSDAAGAARRAETRPPVVLISLESTRADHIPCYGYERNTAPRICELAEDGILFEQAYASGTATHCSIPSMITGILPMNVGLPSWKFAMSDDAPTIGSRLLELGYSTRLEWYPWGMETALDHGFEVSDTLGGELPAAAGTVAERLGEPPFLYWAHFTYWAHVPYLPDSRFNSWTDVPPPEMEGGSGDRVKFKKYALDKGGRQTIVDLYDGEIRQADSYVASILGSLEEAGLYDESLVIVTSDHGEEFGEVEGWNFDIWWHGGRVTHGRTRIPLVVKLPDNAHAGERSPVPVDHTDIAATIYEETGLSTEHLAGTSLRRIHAEGAGDGVAITVDAPDLHTSIVDGTHRLKLHAAGDELCNVDRETKRSLFRIHGFAEERIAKGTDVESPLRDTLCTIVERHDERYPPEPVELTQDSKERLRALGYVE